MKSLVLAVACVALFSCAPSETCDSDNGRYVLVGGEEDLVYRVLDTQTGIVMTWQDPWVLYDDLVNASRWKKELPTAK